MLCAKNLKVLKAALIMILGVWGFTSAQAAFDLTPDSKTHKPAVYAAETIATGKTGQTTHFTTPMATGGVFMASATLEYPVQAGSFVRFDLEPDTAGVTAQFVGPFDPAGTATDWARHGTAPGAAEGRSFGIWTTPAGFPTTAGGNITLSLQNQVLGPDGTTAALVQSGPRPNKVRINGASGGGDYKIMLRMRIYDADDREAAQNGSDDDAAVNMVAPIIAVDNTLNVAIAEADKAIASVAEGFAKFTTGNSATLANVHLSVKTEHTTPARQKFPVWSAATGETITIPGAMGTTNVHIDGDSFAVGTFTLDGTGTLHDANGKELEKYTEGDNKGDYKEPSDATQARFTVTSSGTPNDKGVIMKPFMVTVDAKNTMPIPESEYAATIAPMAALMTAATPATVKGEAGEIDRDGTTVHLSYLTTYEGHNQRLVIVNRGMRPAPYNLSDPVTEEGTVAMLGKDAVGEIMGNSAVAFQVRDLISFEDGGATRASATLHLDAHADDVSVSTTLVNTMDRSTDTVTYEPEP